MPVSLGSTIDPAATRARILDAATDLFYERGVHAVGVQEIAARAGASKLSLYRNFASKQVLVAAVLAERSERIHAWLRRGTVARRGADPVLAIFDLLSDWYAAADFHGCAIINAATDTRGDGDQSVTDLTRLHLRRYRTLLTERLGQLEPQPHGRQRLARQLLLLIEGATVVAAVDGPGTRSAHDARDAAAALIAAAQARTVAREGR